MGMIVREAVAKGESFRGNCLGGGQNSGGGVIVLGGFHWGGGKSPGGNCPGGISWEAVVREGSCPKGN